MGYQGCVRKSMRTKCNAHWFLHVFTCFCPPRDGEGMELATSKKKQDKEVYLGAYMFLTCFYLFLRTNTRVPSLGPARAQGVLAPRACPRPGQREPTNVLIRQRREIQPLSCVHGCAIFAS